MEPNSPLPLRSRPARRFSPEPPQPPQPRRNHRENIPDSDDFEMEDRQEDELSIDDKDRVEVPCSPYFTRPTEPLKRKKKATHVTQPTQPVPSRLETHREGSAKPSQGSRNGKSLAQLQAETTQQTLPLSVAFGKLARATQRTTQPTQPASRPAFGQTQPTQPFKTKSHESADVGSLRLSPPPDLVGSSFINNSPTQPVKSLPSDYHTQQTQPLARKETQATLIVDRRVPSVAHPTKAGFDFDSENEIIEVPASSPFQQHQKKKSPFFDNSDNISSPVSKSSFRHNPTMAPANKTSRPQKGTNRRPPKFIELPDDDQLSMIKFASSDDDEDDGPYRGDIRPSSFVRKTTNDSTNPIDRTRDSSSPDHSSKLGKRKRADVYLQDIKGFNDIKSGPLRQLARRIQKLAGGGFSAAQCVDACLEANHNEKAAAKLLEQEERGEDTSTDTDDLMYLESNLAAPEPKAKESKKSNSLNMAVNLLSSDNEADMPLAPRVTVVEGKRNAFELLRAKREAKKNGTLKASMGKKPSHSANTSQQSSRSSSVVPQADLPSSRTSATFQRSSSATTATDATDNLQQSSTASKPRRRLIQRLGTSGKQAAAPRIVDLVASSPSPDPEVIELGDDPDDYGDSGDALNVSNREILKFLNESTVTTILAFTNQSEDDAKYFISKQPFANITAAKAVVIERSKSKGSKRQKNQATIGLDIVEALIPTIEAQKCADGLIKISDNRTSKIDSTTAVWNRDKTGRYKPESGLEEANDNQDVPAPPKESGGENSESGSDDDAKDSIVASKQRARAPGSPISLDDSDDEHGDRDYDAHDETFREDGADEVSENDFSQDTMTNKDMLEVDLDQLLRTVASKGQLDAAAGKSSDLKPLPFEAPKMMKGNCVLKKHQLYAMNYLALLRCMKIPAILADDMGLGKTCTVIALLACLVENDGLGSRGNKRFPNLVVVPPSTLRNWEKEIERFAPNLSFVVYKEADRSWVGEELRMHPHKYHLVLTTYTQIGNDRAMEHLRGIVFNMTIYDEGHQRLKNRATQDWNRLIKIKCQWKLILSGTPVQNNFQELISILAFLDPKAFTSPVLTTLEPLFKKKGSMIHTAKGTLLASDRGDKARLMLAPYMIQRRKEDLAMDLPPKNHRIIYCAMTQSQADVHNSVVSRTKSKAPVNAYMRLKQAASHPLVVRHHFSDEMVAKMASILHRHIPPYKEPLILKELEKASDQRIWQLFCSPYKRHVGKFSYEGNRLMDCGKAQKLVSLMTEFRAGDHKALVFTPLAETASLLYELLLAHGFNACFMSGATAVSERQHLIDEFNDNDSVNVFVLTTGTGGAGVNLISATKVVIYDMSDNPQDDIQAENRAHRIGQRKPVEIVRLVTKGSIEETIFAATKKKIEMADKVTSWDGYRPPPTLESADGKLDDLMDVENKTVQKQFVQMCHRAEATVAYNPEDDLELVEHADVE